MALKKKGLLFSTTEEQVITTEFNKGNNHPFFKTISLKQRAKQIVQF